MRQIDGQSLGTMRAMVGKGEEIPDWAHQAYDRYMTVVDKVGGGPPDYRTLALLMIMHEPTPGQQERAAARATASKAGK